MSELWPVQELQEVGVRVFDCEHKTPADAGSGHPYVAIPNIVDGRIDLRNVRRITASDLAIWTRRTRPTEGDVIVTRRGRVGDSAVVPPGLECAIGQNLVILRSDGRTVDQGYLRWAARGPLWSGEVDRLINVGAVFDSLNVRDIPRMRIPIPPLQAQRAIKELASALDDKIAINDQIAPAADELRITRFEAAAREEPTLIPLSSLASFVNGRNFTKDASGSGRMVIRIAEVDSGPRSSTVYNNIETSQQHLAGPGDVLFSWSGTLKVARWSRSEALINQHIFKVIPNAGVPAWMMFDLIAGELPSFRAIAADKATTMGHIQRKHLDKVVVLPKRERWESLDRSLGALWDRALVADMESLALADLRDTLLPRLISGELRIKEAEQLVSNAV